MSRQMIFKKQKFQCGGCAKTLTGKATLPPERARQAMSPPAGWFTTDFDTQEKATGAIAVLRIFSCSEACAMKVLDNAKAGKIEGTVDALVHKFQTVVGRPDLTDEAVAAAPVREPGSTLGDAPDVSRVEVPEEAPAQSGLVVVK